MAKQELLVSYLARTVGVWRAVKVAGYIAAWGMYSESLSDPEWRRTIAGCGEFWRRSESSMLRDQRGFHEAFPGEDNPERLWQMCKAHADLKSRDRATADLLGLQLDWAAV